MITYTSISTKIGDVKEMYLRRQERTNTVRIYGYAVEKFCRDFEIIDAKEIGKIPVGFYQDWVDGLYAEGYSTGTIKLYIRVISNFASYLESYGIIENSPILKFLTFKKETHRVTIISDGDLKALLSDDVKKLQDRLLMRTLLETGKRRGDIANIRLSDIYLVPEYDDEGNFTKMTGIVSFRNEQKTGKSNDMYVSDSFVERFRDYVEQEESRIGTPIPETAYLFGKHGKIQTNEDENDDKGRKNRGQNIYNRVNKICKQVGINPEDITPHVFRHTATTKIARTKGISAAKDFGDWSSSAVMERFYYGDEEGGVVTVANGVF